MSAGIMVRDRELSRRGHWKRRKTLLADSHPLNIIIPLRSRQRSSPIAWISHHLACGDGAHVIYSGRVPACKSALMEGHEMWKQGTELHLAARAFAIWGETPLPTAKICECFPNTRVGPVGQALPVSSPV